MIELNLNIDNIRLKAQDTWQEVVDFLYGERANKIATILYLIIGIFAVINIFSFLKLIKNPILTRNSKYTSQGVFILLSLATFFLSKLGKELKQPSKRVPQFIFIVIAISIFSLTYFANTFNFIFKKALFNIENIEIIPVELITGNIRVVTFLVPLSIIIPISFLTLNVLTNKDNKKKLKELEIDMLLPTVHKSDDTTIDIKICDDIDTGLPCIVPEKVAYEHFWIQGGTGSGKTSQHLLPLEEQLLKKKSYLNHKLKESVYYCLKNNIARINKPVTNKWFNENFDIGLIEPIKGKEEDFLNEINKQILGIRDDNKVVFNETINTKKEIELESLKAKNCYYEINLEVSKNNMDIDSFVIKLNKFQQNMDLKLNKYGTLSSVVCERELYVDEDTADFKLSEDMSQIIKIEITPNKDYRIKTTITFKGTGEVVPKDLGMTIIAPDGDLIKKSVEIANEYGVKIHKIDPFIEEIYKGNVAKFNPLKGDSPEKIGDIIASILVSMESGQSTKVNPYYTNASVRAIRNLVILLKVAYPKIHGQDPTLENVLSCLNDFNRVTKYVECLESNAELSGRWSSVIDYFKANFYDLPKDHREQPIKRQNTATTNIPTTAIGSQKKKTQEALGGIINQLDNLLARKEIRYILCSPNESIDLKQALNKGEVIAVSTRQGDLGARLGRAFALFFILSLQNEVLSRYAEGENPEIPHYLIIDEFPMYCNENTETFFTFARKYKCSVTIAIQNMGQLKKISDEFGETIFTNTTNKLLLPKSNLEDRKYWSAYFGKTQKMDLMTGVSKGALSADNPSYSEQMRGGIKKVENVAEDEINDLNFQNLFYSYTNHKGRQVIGKGETDFVSVNKETFMDKTYDFEKYCISKEEYMRKVKEKEIITKHNEKKKEKESISKIVYSPDSINNTNNMYEEVLEEVPIEETKDKTQEHKDKENALYKPTVTKVFEEIPEETLLNIDNNISQSTTETIKKDNSSKLETDRRETNNDESTVSFSMDDDIKTFFTSEE